VSSAASATESHLSPKQRYQRDLRNGFTPDPAQAAAVDKIQQLYEALLTRPSPSSGLRALLARLRRSSRQAPRGLYLWGGVGRGKTWLMDCFYECLPLTRKRRVHFHRFMEDVHDRLRALGQIDNPLDRVGAELANESEVICFDEFFVNDIADAMILARLLQVLFQRDVTLVATSNVPPSALYRDGLQRAKFLPAIELLEQHTQVLNVDSGTDYRLRILKRAQTYYSPLNEAAAARLQASFEQLAPGQWIAERVIQINHRPIKSIAVADGIGWFHFEALCQQPRSPADYIELARRFNTILVSEIPQLSEQDNDAARRLINLIDELYDRNVNLMVSATTEPDQLYRGERLEFEFRRTVSRLHEMQSHQYLGLEHRP